MEQSKGVIDKVFEMLEVVASSQKPMSLADIVTKTEVNKTTAHRLLQSLVSKGYVSKNLEGKYVLGTKYIQLASYYINSLELQTEANPYLSVLYSQVNLTVVLGVLKDSRLVYVTKLDKYPTQKSFEKVGYIAPIYCSSIGKILLSALSGGELEEVLEDIQFEKFTENTITSERELKEHLKEVRKKCWGMDNEESAIDHRCIAVPIYDYTGSVVASVGVSGTKEQLPDEKLQTIIREVFLTANQISARMGYIV
ncbi:MAG: IclR family transcriptional regulator [Bacillota bacterium]